MPPMIDLYYAPTPNGWKISIMLEELGLPYNLIPVNIRVGDQFKPEFLAISPNNRIPAIVDHAPADGGGPFSVFETGAILIYLADKTGRFLPAEQLKQRFADKLQDRSPEELVAYCGSGVTACHNLFALCLAGYPLGKLYAGSWSEWITDPQRAIATGD